MVCTTAIEDWEQNVPTKDEDLNELIQEVREVSGKNWQVVERKRTKKRWFRKDKTYYWYGLYLEIGGFLPFQVLTCVHTARECKCYLYGLLSGLRKETTE